VARRFTLTAPVLREHPLHKQIADVFRLELAAPGRISRDGVVWFAVDIANYGGTTPGLRTTRGVIAGIPDLFVLYRGTAHMIEVKAEDGLLSDAQRGVAAAVLGAGGHIGVARNADEALACLDEWRIPRNRRVKVAA
jgi:hypothetical protein